MNPIGVTYENFLHEYQMMHSFTVIHEILMWISLADAK